jgi:hypothetical protein
LGKNGISSWMFAVSDIDLPFGKDLYARNSWFVYPLNIALVFREAEKAIPSLIVENAKNIQSYSFRRKWINYYFSVDVNSFVDSDVRALATYVYWYKICLLRSPNLILRLNNIDNDIQRIAKKLLFFGTKSPVKISHEPIHSKKPYHKYIFKKPDIDFQDLIARSPVTLREKLSELNNEIQNLASLILRD